MRDFLKGAAVLLWFSFLLVGVPFIFSHIFDIRFDLAVFIIFGCYLFTILSFVIGEWL